MSIRQMADANDVPDLAEPVGVLGARHLWRSALAGWVSTGVYEDVTS
jgi:hypothetical protein